MTTPDPKRPLDYATPRAERPPRRQWRFDGVYFAAALLLFAVAVASLLIANRYDYVLYDLPDDDRRWADRVEDERWFTIGCGEVPIFVVMGLILLVRSFHRVEVPDDEPPVN